MHYTYTAVQSAVNNSIEFLGHVEITRLAHVLLNSDLGLSEVDQDNLILMIYNSSPLDKIVWKKNEKARVLSIVERLEYGQEAA